MQQARTQDTKKFRRLPPEARRAEIKAAAAALFAEKGFAAVTMENIVDHVSLSKGGVYRIYPSTAAILSDLMIDGMHLRNAFYAQRVEEAAVKGQTLDLPFLSALICDSLLLSPETSALYVEFLWEKRRDPALEDLYRTLCGTAEQETLALMERCGADRLLTEQLSMGLLTDLMNAAILALHVLDLKTPVQENREQLSAAMTAALSVFCTAKSKKGEDVHA